jgi:hypothetical protein
MTEAMPDKLEQTFPYFFEKLQIEKNPVLFLKLIENRDTSIFYIDRIDFPRELREKTNAMIKELVRLLFEEFYSRSLYWQKSNERWKRRTRKWGKDFRECARLYLEGFVPTLQIPPIYKGTRVFLAIGTATFFKMESKLIIEFIRKAMPVIKRYASKFRFMIISSYRRGRRKFQDIDKVVELWG